MKPNFALGLTEHGITLWMRDANDWLRVGAVAMDAPDLDTQMQALVAKARALTSEPIVTKLVIPDEQVLYTRLDVAPDPQAIRAALDGRTPYPVEELDFDWVTDNGSVLVAVVARETLIEAEDFAKSQGLNPVCFVAAPEGKGFAQEPFFKAARGVSTDAKDLGRGGPILRETGHAKTPEAPEPIETAPTDAKPSKQDTSKPVAPPSATSEAKPAQRGADPVPSAKSTPPHKAKPALVATEKTTGAAPQAAPDKAKPKSRPDAPSKPAVSQADAAVGFRSRRHTVANRKGRFRITCRQIRTGPRPGRAPQRDPEALSNTSKLSLGRLGGAALAGKLRASVAEPVARAGSGLRSATDVLGRSLAPRTKTENAASASKDTAKASARSESSGANGSGVATGDAGKGKAAGKKAAQTPGKTRNGPVRQGAAKRPEADPEADRLTVFGARRMAATAEQTLPRRALLVSGAALMLVLAVAVWVFYFNRASVPDSAAPVLPADTASEIAAPDPLALEDFSADSANDIEAALGVTDAAQDQGGLPDAQAQEDAVQTERPADDQPPAVASADQDAGRLAALRSVRALAPEAPGDLPNVQDAPVPFGSRELPPLRDEATPDVTQETGQDDGVTTAGSTLPPGEEALEIAVTNGTPASVPPARPAGIAPEPTPEPELAPETDPEPAEPVAVDESTLEIDVTQSTPPSVPPARPAGIAPEAAPAAPDVPEDAPQPDAPADAEDEQASRAVSPGGVALTALTPAARPAEIVEEAVAQAERYASATPQAVAASRRPSNRPSGFSQTVQRALAAAQARQSAAPEPDIVQASASSVAPRIPSSASVSRAATQTRAINPRKMNLLGVMGTPSARRALVRLGSGRVVTVKVGARLDGGQVTAIGDSELRYQKRGRDLVLRIAS